VLFKRHSSFSSQMGNWIMRKNGRT
jgi:hypothetical protein